MLSLSHLMPKSCCRLASPVSKSSPKHSTLLPNCAPLLPIRPEPFGPDEGENRENNKAEHIERKRLGKIKVDEVHAGAGHATAGALLAQK